jgi:hypothetical protein
MHLAWSLMEDNVKALSRSVAIILLLWLLFFLAVYNLDVYPSLWFDEGIHLQPPKNLVLYGEYAVRESGVLHRFNSIVSTGPPLLLPIAFAFSVMGIDLWVARFVTVSYLMLAAVTFYQLACQLYGRKVALVALGLIIASPGLGFVPLGRQVMGEVPALFFFLSGTLAWVYAIRHRRPLLLVLAGLALGLAMITKNVYGLILPACWFLLWIVSRWHRGQISFLYFLCPLFIALTCLAVWYGFQSASLGFTAFRRDTLGMGASAGRSIFVFVPQRRLASLRSLLGPNLYMAFGVPGLLYSLYMSIRERRSLIGLQRVFLLLTTIVWLAWYVLASVGWQRYAFPALMIMAMFTARLFLDLGSRVVRFLHSRIGEKRGLVEIMVNGLGLVTVMVLLCFFPWYRTSLLEEAVAILRANDDAAQRFGDYLTAHVPLDALIESWEWEIDFFTDHTYHHPPSSVLDVMTRRAFLGGTYSYDMYDFEQYHPDYIINGPFSKWTGLYSANYLDEECVLVVSIGAYDLHQINAD